MTGIPAGSSHNRLKPLVAESMAHFTRLCKPRGLGRRSDMLDVDNWASATSWSQSSVEFHTDREGAGIRRRFVGREGGGALRLRLGEDAEPVIWARCESGTKWR